MRCVLTALLIIGTAALAQTGLEGDVDAAAPRAILQGDALVILDSLYDDMQVADGLLIVSGRSQADTLSGNVAQARAMAEKAAPYAARQVLVEFFTALGCSAADAQTNAAYGETYGETAYFSDGTVEVYLAIPLEGPGGLLEAYASQGVTHLEVD